MSTYLENSNMKCDPKVSDLRSLFHAKTFERSLLDKNITSDFSRMFGYYRRQTTHVSKCASLQLLTVFVACVGFCYHWKRWKDF